MTEKRPGCRQAAQETARRLAKSAKKTVWELAQQPNAFALCASARYLTAGKSSDQQEEQASARPTTNKTD